MSARCSSDHCLANVSLTVKPPLLVTIWSAVGVASYVPFVGPWPCGQLGVSVIALPDVEVANVEDTVLVVFSIA